MSSRGPWKAWSIEDDRRLFAYAQDGIPVGEEVWTTIVAQFPGRSLIACRDRLRKMIADAREAKRKRASPVKVKLMQRPRDFPLHATLTALICGDPIPGRSALDQRKAYGTLPAHG